MKFILKKFTALFLVLGFTVFSAFAQEENTSSYELYSMRLGAYGSYSRALGNMGNYISGNAGGAAVLEIDFFEHFGIGVNLEGNGNFVASEKLESVWNLHPSVKAYMRFDLFYDFYIQPEVSYGMIGYFPKKSDDYDGQFKSFYADQAVMAGVGIRYAPLNLLDGAIEFELFPFYLFSPETGNNNSFVGGRFGVYCRIK